MHIYFSSNEEVLLPSKILHITIGIIASKILFVNNGFISIQFLKICKINILKDFSYIIAIRKKNKNSIVNRSIISIKFSSFLGLISSKQLFKSYIFIAIIILFS